MAYRNRCIRLDPATGKLSDAEGPSWDEAEAIRAFLKPAFEGIRERLERRTGRSIASFGEDDEGELYVCSFDGGVW